MPDLTDLLQEQEAEFNANALAEHNRRNNPRQMQKTVSTGDSICLDCEKMQIPLRSSNSTIYCYAHQSRDEVV